MRKNVYIIVNSDCLVSKWQYNCILKLKEYKINFLISNEVREKKFSKKKRNYLKNFVYYLINLFSIRQPKVKIKFNNFKNASVKNIWFTIRNDSWQVLTNNSINEIISSQPYFIYKCGMNLLHLSDELKNIPIISHHHGDPSKFRGRPAGFYEIIQGEKKLGQMIQLISNKLDGGRILAFAETKIYPWSYKRTLKDAYAISHIVFEKALKNLEKGHFIDKEPINRIYKLPSNILGIIFIWRELFNFFSKIIYGLFFEKYWQVSYYKDFSISNIDDPINLLLLLDSSSKNFKTIKISKAYDFFADPFIIDSNIIVEGLNRFSCKGSLLCIDIESDKIIQKINLKNKHLSYPFTKEFFGKKYIYPDSGSLNRAILYSGYNQSSLKISTMKGFKSGLIDPSVIEHDGLFYLFANYPEEKFVLRLWISSNPNFNDACEHPESPICISPQGGRSGGRIFKLKEKIYRFGQDYTGDYGNGLILFEITLNKESYFEKQLSTYRFNSSLKGPHTIDFSSNLLTWDFYIDKFNFFAGIKRILGRL